MKIWPTLYFHQLSSRPICFVEVLLHFAETPWKLVCWSPGSRGLLVAFFFTLVSTSLGKPRERGKPDYIKCDKLSKVLIYLSSWITDSFTMIVKIIPFQVCLFTGSLSEAWRRPWWRLPPSPTSTSSSKARWLFLCSSPEPRPPRLLWRRPRGQWLIRVFLVIMQHM